MVTQDDKLKDSHNHLLKTVLPLTHLFDALVDPTCPETIDSSLVLQHITSALILLGSASQSLALSRQHTFDDLLDRFDSLKRNFPFIDSLFEGNLAKDIEDAEKAKKLAAKVTKASAVTRKLRVGCSFQGRSIHNNIGPSNLQRQVVGDFDHTGDQMVPSQNSRNCRNSVYLS